MKGYAREKIREITADRSALRKCRNVVSAGVLSPISSAVGRNGAVGDKRNACAGARLHLIRHGFAVPPVSLRVGRFAGLTRHRRVIQHREPLKGKANGGVSFNTADPSRGRLGGGGGRSGKFLPWLGQAAASASAPVNAGTVLLTDNGDERLCPREDTGNHSRP